MGNRIQEGGNQMNVGQMKVADKDFVVSAHFKCVKCEHAWHDEISVLEYNALIASGQLFQRGFLDKEGVELKLKFCKECG